MADVRAGAEQVQGQAATNTTLKGNPVLIGGSDGTNVQNIKVDASGNLNSYVFGPTAAGASATFSPVMMAGIDSGSLVRTLKTDTNGAIAAGLTEVTGTATTVAVFSNFPVNVSGHRWVAITISSNSASASNVNFEQSLDNSTWIACALNLSAFPYVAPINTGSIDNTNTFMFYGPIHGKYFRVRATSIGGSATLTATAHFSTLPSSLSNMGVAVAGATGTGSAATTPPILVGGADGGSLIRTIKTDSSGNVGVYEAGGSDTVTTATAISTAGTSVTISTAGLEDCACYLNMTAYTSGTATFVFEGSVDGTNFVSIYGFSSSQQIMVSTLSFTAVNSDVCMFSAAGFSTIRIRCTVAATGQTATAYWRGSVRGGPRRIAGFQANAVLPTLVENQPTNAAVDLNGALYVIGKPSTAVQKIFTASITEQTGVAAPGAGISIFVTSMCGTNSGTAATQVDFRNGTGSGNNVYSFFMAAQGGGFSHSMLQPWKLTANTGLFIGNSVSTSSAIVTVNYYTM
jgi:hypothetical protein